jgi:integrase
MPRLNRALPHYRLHRASGQAVVTLGGRDHYLGPFGSPQSRTLYDELIAQWLASGRKPPAPSAPPSAPLTVVGLVALYWQFAKGYYVKAGKPTGELTVIKPALRRLCALCGPIAAECVTPQMLRELQERMIEEDLARTYINKEVDRIRRMFRWAVSEGLVPVTVHQALLCVSGLRRGRTAARETDPVRPVADDIVEATLPFLPTVVADIVRFQRLVGCRPAEACGLRPADIDRSGDVWIYTPQSHKTEHHGHDRRIPIGPRAQEVIRPYLSRPSTAFCFSPREAESARRERQRSQRQTAVQPSQQHRKKVDRKRSPSDHYDTRAFNRAISRACQKAGVLAWSAP